MKTLSVSASTACRYDRTAAAEICFVSEQGFNREEDGLAHLFAYGTLQNPLVREGIFGRSPDGEPDELPGFEVSFHDSRQLADDEGQPQYLVARFTGNPDGRISGTVFELSDAELHAADAYETNAYRRILVRLASGRDAWVYVRGE